MIKTRSSIDRPLVLQEPSSYTVRCPCFRKLLGTMVQVAAATFLVPQYNSFLRLIDTCVMLQILHAKIFDSFTAHEKLSQIFSLMTVKQINFMNTVFFLISSAVLCFIEMYKFRMIKCNCIHDTAIFLFCWVSFCLPLTMYKIYSNKCNCMHDT